MRLNRLYLSIIGTIFLCGMASYALVWAVDPYDLRPGGVRVRLADHPYIDRIVPRLFSVAAHDGSDIVLVGGSTSMLYSSGMLKEAFPDAQRPVNLSFLAPRAADFKRTLERIEQSTSLKRVLINLEWPFVRDAHGFGFERDAHFYDVSWFDPVPEFNLESIEASANVVRTAVLDLAKWQRPDPRTPDVYFSTEPLTGSPAKIAKLANAADATRAGVVQAPLISCDAIGNLQTILLPFVKRMAARGVSIDLILPPYSIAIYSDWSVDKLYGKIFPGRGAPFANLISLRKCVVEMTSGIEHVRVHGFDTDFSITEDLSRYMDSAHLNDHKTYREILLHIAKGDAVLTPAKWPAYESALRDAVQKYRP